MKKEIFLKLLFGAVITYLASLLLFVTCKHVFSLDASHLSALGSILGAGATFFAAFTAWVLFNDWKEKEKITFIRDISHETASLITQLMLSMQQYPQLSLSEIRVLHSKIVTNLSFLNRQIKDDQMDKVNKNFGIFMEDFYNITIMGIDNSLSSEQIKKEINKNNKSFSTEFTYISELVDINNVYKKVKASI